MLISCEHRRSTATFTARASPPPHFLYPTTRPGSPSPSCLHSLCDASGLGARSSCGTDSGLNVTYVSLSAEPDPAPLAACLSAAAHEISSAAAFAAHEFSSAAACEVCLVAAVCDVRTSEAAESCHLTCS